MELIPLVFTAVAVALTVLVFFSRNRQTPHKSDETVSQEQAVERQTEDPTIQSGNDIKDSSTNSIGAADRSSPIQEGAQIDAAIDILSQAIAANGTNFKARAARSAVLLAKFKQLSESFSESELSGAAALLMRALEDAEICLRLDPLKSEGYMCKINILRSIEEYQDALEVCQSGRAQLPSCALLRQAEAELLSLTSDTAPASMASCCGHDHAHSHSHSHNHSHSYSHDHQGDMASRAKIEKLTAAYEANISKKIATCSYCDAVSSKDRPLSICGGCKLVYYCSRECQLADRSDHRASCKAAITALSSTEKSSEKLP